MKPIAHLSSQKQLLLQQLVEQLSRVEGVVGVVLGGSYASGSYHPGSDLDVGLYYFEKRPFSIATIRQIAEAVSTEDPVMVTDFYEWGPWVNGGAWIHTAHGKVDFLYRHVDQVRRTIADAQQGVVHHDYHQQPTFGFTSVIYLAETAICIPLFDPEGILKSLKAEVAVYPPRLKQRTIADALWSAEFTLLHATSFASQGDVYNTVGCLARAASSLTQVLFALNEVYFISDKKAMERIAAFPVAPPGYVERLGHILGNAGETVDALSASTAALHELWAAVAALDGVNYTPKFLL
jgi:predicted nucleotidyltransferase